MTASYSDAVTGLIHGDCLAVMAMMPEDSVSAIVTDPPYGLGFMGKKWDALPPGLDWAKACYRVLKPGGHLLAFGGSRTWHRLAAAVEDAGFEIRDSIAWLYGSGFPKSLDVSKAIDKTAGAEREVIGAGQYAGRGRRTDNAVYSEATPSDHEVITSPATDDAKRWQGWGTALKPAFEPIVVARKPLAGTVAANVLEHGTGALNIDACRVETSPEDAKAMERANTPGSGRMRAGGSPIGTFERSSATGAMDTTQGRWPANVLLDESQAAELDEQSGIREGGHTPKRRGGVGYSGGASRFFYVAKAPTKERPRLEDGTAHPTVKPLTLMRWLVRLVGTPGGVIFDPFLGTGTTAEACYLEGFPCIGTDSDDSAIELCQVRMAKHAPAEVPS